MRVGLIGVGTMGSRMAANLVKGGFEVLACDLKPEAQRGAADLGAKVYPHGQAIAREADLTLMSLPMPADVYAVVAGEHGILEGASAGHIIVDLSTVDPGSTQRNAALAAGRSVQYLDAPVLGRPQGCGNWTLPVGGDPGALDRVRDVLGTLAKKVVHVGPSGHGNIIKLLNNMMFGAINAVTAEVMALSAAMGVAPRTFYEVVADSGAATVSNLFRELGPKMVNRDFTPLFTIDLLHKDMMLGIGMAQERGVPLFVSGNNQLVNVLSRTKGLGGEDTSAVVKLYEDFLNRQ